jgi:phosphatidyl-myo-inositol alpha-mannosyltransferase
MKRSGKMRIGLVCPYNNGGGVEKVVKALCDGLKERGHYVKIITPNPRPHEVNHYNKEDTIFVGGGINFNSPTMTQTQLSASRDGDDIIAMLEREKFDILNFHEPPAPMLSRQILSRSNAINIGTFHSKIPETMMIRTVARVITPYTKSIMKYLHELTAVSEAGGEWASSLTNKHITIIPNGIDLKKYIKPKDRNVAASPQKNILFIGRLERRKGVKYLLRAYGYLAKQEPHVTLTITGDGPDREKLENQIKELELPNVKFTGFVSDDDKLGLLAKADLFCSPAIVGESFGIVLLEAMATGLVTVAGDNSGYSSVMQGLGEVSLVNPRDSIEFARRLHLLLYENELRELWQKWALNYVKQFDWPKVVDQYEEFYQQALKRHR